jgi:hypothetical protein
MRVRSKRDQLFFSTIRAIVDDYAATAFCVAYCTPRGDTVPLVVTNRHVVEDEGGRPADHGLLFIQQAIDEKLRLGDPYVFERRKNFGELWFMHPDRRIDIAISPFEPIEEELNRAGAHSYQFWVSEEHVPEHGLSVRNDELHPLETFFPPRIDSIEEILFVGYPSGLYDHVNHLPLVRKGISSSPIQVDHGGQPVFLIDAPVLRGSSGSPVFISDSASLLHTQHIVPVGKDRLIFLGMISDILLGKPSAITTSSGTLLLDAYLGLGSVWKARAIFATIEHYLRLTRRWI